MGQVIQLPKEVLSLLEMEQIDDARQEELNKFASVISGKREEAVLGRRESGIEDVWMACEEAYLGIDDVNRSDFKNQNWAKPTTMQGGLSYDKSNQGYKGSTAFVRLTSRYVDAGHAKIAEILLPVDDKPFSFEPTPIPDLIKRKDDATPVMVNGQPVMKPALDMSGQPMTDANGQPVSAPLTISDQIKQIFEKAEESAKGAETKIYDWMVESQYASQMRKVLFDAARIGVGVLKGPFPVKSKSQSVETGEDGSVTMVIKEETKPGYLWRDPWNIFPDPACGENIQHGSYLFERDYLSRRQVIDLKGLPGYIPSQINKVLGEGPQSPKSDATRYEDGDRKKKRYEVWYYHGDITREEMNVMEAIGRDELPEEQEQIYAIVTMINDTAVRCSINPLDSGKLPYHGMPWQRRANYWAGVGVGEQIAMPQRMVNAATRNMMNNASKSSGCQIVMDKGVITPADNSWTITQDKLWHMVADAVQKDVRQAFATFEFPNRTPEMMTVIEYAFRLAEESCNIPLISQGQSGKTTPDTYGAAQLQNNNANQLLRNIGYTADDFITEPVVIMSYEWLLMDPNVPDEYKGDFKINAHGSTSLVERAIQDEALLQLGSMVADPEFGMNKKRYAEVLMKSKRLDPRTVQNTEEEQKQLDEAMQQQAQQGDPRVQGQIQVQQLRNQGDEKKETLRQSTDMEELRFKSTEADKQRAHEKEIAEMNHQTELIKLAQSSKLSLDDLKVKLAMNTQKLATQKELSPKSQVATPASEPAGRAEAGHAYEQ